MIHNAFQITDVLRIPVREGAKNTYSYGGDDFASALALYSGNDSIGIQAGQDAARVPEGTIHGDTNESTGSDKAGEMSKTGHAPRNEADYGKPSSGAVNTKGQRKTEKDTDTHNKGKADVKGQKKVLKPDVAKAKKLEKKLRMGGKTKAAGTGSVRGEARLVKDKKYESASDITKTKKAKTIKRHIRAVKISGEAQKHITTKLNEKKTGMKLPILQVFSNKNNHRAVKISKAGKRLKKQHLGQSAKAHSWGVRHKIESALFDNRQDTAKFQKVTKTGDDVSAFLKYEHSAQNVGVKTHYQFQKIADVNFDEIIKQFTLILNRGGGEAHLHLHPESLGELKLRIKLSNNEVSTNMLVDNQSVKDLIMERLNILEESLQEQGFQLGSFQVEVKDRQNNSHEVFNGAGRGTAASVKDDEKTIIGDEASAVPPWMSTLINITV